MPIIVPKIMIKVYFAKNKIWNQFHDILFILLLKSLLKYTFVKINIFVHFSPHFLLLYIFKLWFNVFLLGEIFANEIFIKSWFEKFRLWNINSYFIFLCVIIVNYNYNCNPFIILIFIFYYLVKNEKSIPVFIFL